MKHERLSVVADDVFALRRLYLKAFGKPALLNSSISPLAYMIMLHLKSKSLLSMTEISKKLGVPKPNATVLIDKLIEKKLTERVNDAKDRRIVMIKLTKKGIEFLESARKIYHAQITDKLLQLKEADLKQFAEALVIVKNTLAALETIE
jgi:DNA-binding MarR family transcriptional regulator